MNQIESKVFDAIAKVEPMERSRSIYFGWIMGGLQSGNRHFVSDVSNCRFSKSRKRFTARAEIVLPDSDTTISRRYVWTATKGRYKARFEN